MRFTLSVEEAGAQGYLYSTVAKKRGMPAPAYTQNEAAIHELGHTIVACALGLPFRHVEIRPAVAPRMGWEGQCLLVTLPRRVAGDAFQLGGPLLQILMDSTSLSGHHALFHPSLFSNAVRCLDTTDAFSVIEDQLARSSDLCGTGMMHQVSGWPAFQMNLKGFGGSKPWVLDLERHVRAFLFLPLVQELATELCLVLVREGRMQAQPVFDAFNAKLSQNHYAVLRAYVATQPD